MFYIVPKKIGANPLTPQVVVNSIMTKVFQMFSQIRHGVINLAA